MIISLAFQTPCRWFFPSLDPCSFADTLCTTDTVSVNLLFSILDHPAVTPLPLHLQHLLLLLCLLLSLFSSFSRNWSVLPISTTAYLHYTLASTTTSHKHDDWLRQRWEEGPQCKARRHLIQFSLAPLYFAQRQWRRRRLVASWCSIKTRDNNLTALIGTSPTSPLLLRCTHTLLQLFAVLYRRGRVLYGETDFRLPAINSLAAGLRDVGEKRERERTMLCCVNVEHLV